jgi:hypothetical protein
MGRDGFGGLVRAAPATISRRRALGRIGTTMVTLPIVSAPIRRARASQGQVTEIGRAPVGQHAFQLIGTIEQRGFDFTAYGFLMQIANLDFTHLFTDDDAFNRSAATARLTFWASATATARAVHHPLFVIEAAGNMTFHINEAGGATFEEPESFAAGTAVASAVLTVHNVVNVPQPQIGFTSGYADVVLESSDPFTLGDNDYLFGGPGLAARMSLVGQGTLLDPELPEAVIRFVGDAESVA